MAKTKKNNRCPLQAECEKVCQWQGRELDCPYYDGNARPGYELEDQAAIRGWSVSQLVDWILRESLFSIKE